MFRIWLKLSWPLIQVVTGGTLSTLTPKAGTFHERLLGGSRYVLDAQDQVVDDVRVEQFFQLGIGAVDPNTFQRLARLSRIIIHKGDDLVSATCVAVEVRLVITPDSPAP